MINRILQRSARLLGGSCFGVALLAMGLSASAQLSITGVADKSTYSATATFTVVVQAGYSYGAALNGSPVPVGAAVTVTRMDYYDLQAWRTNLSAPFDVTNLLVRFIVIASDRGAPEKGLIKWTPYPLIRSTAAEWAGAELQIMTPRDYPAGLPIPVIARVEDAQGRERRANGFVTAPGFAASTVKILRGHGSGFLPAATVGGTISYNAQLHSMEAPRQINIDSSTIWTSVSGALPLQVEWPEDSRIHLTGHVTVPINGTLTIGAGTIIKLDPLVNITNSGTLTINGTTARPVVFTSTNVVWPEKNAGAWGGFLLRGDNSRLVANGTIFTGGGGATSFDFSPGASHRSEQAVLLIQSGAHARLTNCAIINTAGQVANGYDCDYILDHCLCQRAITCGEYSGSSSYVLINHSALIEFPEDNGIVDATIADADYDAIYFTEGTHIVLNSLVGFAMDDALDSGSGGAGTMWVSNCWVEAALHEAHAWSGGGRQAWSYDSVLMNCGQGLENGWSTGSDSPLVYAERMLSTANSVGLRTGDNYDWSYNGHLNVTNSLILYNYRDVFLKTWNATDTGWQTNSWVDRVDQCHFGTNLITTTDPRFPSNLAYDPARDGAQLAHWMTTPPDAPVGIGLAVRTNRFTLAQLTNGVPVRLSSFTTNFVAVDYAVIGTNGTVAGGTLQFAPGETVKHIPPFWPATNDLVLEVALRNPVHGELTSVAQAWYFKPVQPNASPVTLITNGAVWKYLDTGTNLGTAWATNNLTGWTGPDFADGSWPSGPAPLGYGDANGLYPATTNQWGDSSTSKYITYYYRHAFVVSNAASFANLTFNLMRDDGVVVYLNGTEAFRDNMPTDTITYTNKSANTVSGTAESAIYPTTVATSSLGQPLREGTNIVAVEIHQDLPTSSDIWLELQLVGTPASSTVPPAITRSPTNQTVMTNDTAVFTVEATGAAPLAYQWWHNGQPVEVTIGPALTLANVTAADAGSYYVVVLNHDGSATSQIATLTIADADTDGDGITDGWERDHDLDPAVNDANLDPDGDGMPNLQEFLAGTHPQDRNSYLKVEAVEPGLSGGTFTIQFSAMATKTYTVLYSDVAPTFFWFKLEDIAATPTNRVVVVTDTSVPSLRRFYRLVTPAQP